MSYSLASPVFHVQDLPNLTFYAGPGEIVNPNPDAVCPAHLRRVEIIEHVITRLAYFRALAAGRELSTAVLDGARERLTAQAADMRSEVAAMDFCIASGDPIGGQMVARQVVDALPAHRCRLDGIAGVLRGAARTYGPDQSDIWTGLLGLAVTLTN